MGKRYMILSAFIVLVVYAISWQLQDDGILTTESFAMKLAVTGGAYLVSMVLIRLLIGKKEEGVHL